MFRDSIRFLIDAYVELFRCNDEFTLVPFGIWHLACIHRLRSHTSSHPPEPSMKTLIPIVTALLLSISSPAFAEFGVASYAPAYAPDIAPYDPGDFATPYDFGQGETVSSDILFFYEKTDTYSAMPVDYVSNGGPAVVNGEYSSPGSLTGTYRSYFFHFDPDTAGATSASGSITFDAPIVAIAFNQSTLLSSDDLSYVYEADPSRGIEASDGFTINGNSLSFILLMAGAGDLDNFRVFTAVPEVSTIVAWLLLAGLAFVAYRHLYVVPPFGRPSVT